MSFPLLSYLTPALSSDFFLYLLHPCFLILPALFISHLSSFSTFLFFPSSSPSPPSWPSLLQGVSTWRASCCSALQDAVKHWWPGRLARCSTPVSQRSSMAQRSSTNTWESLRPTSANCLLRQRRSRRGWEKLSAHFYMFTSQNKNLPF